MTMSTSFAISSQSGPHTPLPDQATSVQLSKSSPVSKVYNYSRPENCEQYQKFGYDKRILLGVFDDKSKFLKFLDVELPDSIPNPWKGERSFLESANKVARFIKSKHFPDGDTLVFEDTGNKSLPGHVTDTVRGPDITAAFKPHWKLKEGVVPWPFIQFVGEMASGGKSHHDQLGQAISYLHYLLLARPDLYIAQGLLSSDKKVIFLFGIGGEGVRQFNVEWKDQELNKLLYAFIYRLYEPHNFVDPSYINTKFDEETTAKYTINIAYWGGMKECCGFYSIYARNPFATRTHVLSNPNFEVEGNGLTILKDQFCQVKRHFEELTILNEYVHKPERVPGMVVAAYGEQIWVPLSEERCKRHLGLGESGSPFMSIPTLSKVLEMLFDVLEVLRYLRFHCNVLHRDISSGNVLYVENLSNRSLLPNTLSVPPAQDAETNRLPLCYAKRLLGKSDNPSETSMLLVDFNLAEHLEPKMSVKKQIERMGTPIFIARAVEQNGPVLPTVAAFIPRIHSSPDVYAEAHLDRVTRFPVGLGRRIPIDPKDPELVGNNKSRGRWRHELEHDAESVFWLLLYWAMVVQPEGRPMEKVEAEPWSQLNGNHKSRGRLLGTMMSSNVTHLFYKPLQPLIEDLAAIIVIDNHWLPASDPRKDPFYITEAFQRLILKFIIDNHGKEFMDHRVEETFREVRRIQASGAWSSTHSQSLDATTREGVIPGTDDVEMDDIQ